jgi:hypothetical protein
MVPVAAEPLTFEHQLSQLIWSSADTVCLLVLIPLSHCGFLFFDLLVSGRTCWSGFDLLLHLLSLRKRLVDLCLLVGSGLVVSEADFIVRPTGLSHFLHIQRADVLRLVVLLLRNLSELEFRLIVAHDDLLVLR